MQTLSYVTFSQGFCVYLCFFHILSVCCPYINLEAPDSVAFDVYDFWTYKVDMLVNKILS